MCEWVTEYVVATQVVGSHNQVDCTELDERGREREETGRQKSRIETG